MNAPLDGNQARLKLDFNLFCSGWSWPSVCRKWRRPWRHLVLGWNPWSPWPLCRVRGNRLRRALAQSRQVHRWAVITFAKRHLESWKKNLFRWFFISTPRVLIFSSEQQPASQDFFFCRPKPSDKPWRLMLRMLDRFSLACLALMWAVRYESEAINKDCLPSK